MAQAGLFVLMWIVSRRDTAAGHLKVWLEEYVRGVETKPHIGARAHWLEVEVFPIAPGSYAPSGNYSDLRLAIMGQETRPTILCK
jgi:hypothetical protein